MKNVIITDWERNVATLWSIFEELTPALFLNRMTTLVRQLPEDDSIGLFELVSANDSTGNESTAAPLYVKALNQGLTGIRRRLANIQLASTLRSLGEPKKVSKFFARNSTLTEMNWTMLQKHFYALP